MPTNSSTPVIRWVMEAMAMMGKLNLVSDKFTGRSVFISLTSSVNRFNQILFQGLLNKAPVGRVRRLRWAVLPEDMILVAPTGKSQAKPI